MAMVRTGTTSARGFRESPLENRTGEEERTAYFLPVWFTFFEKVLLS